MKRSTGIAVGIATSLALGLGTAAYAHQGEMGDGAHARGGMQHGMHGGMGHGAAHQLMTPEERTALRELINTRLFKGSTAAITGEQLHALAETDFAVLQKELMARKLRCRVFTSTVPVRAARWMTSNDQRP